MKVAFATLGCKVNHYETEAMRELFTGSGWECVPFPEPADVYIVNTCTVTGTGDSKSRQLIARAHRASPDATLLLRVDRARAKARMAGGAAPDRLEREKE